VSVTLFISDLHLDTARPAVTQALAKFLQQNRSCQCLYILGDLFEVWLGDDDDSALAAEIGGLLKEFAASGSALYLMHGNRDFLLGQDFCNSIGAELLADPTVIDLYGQPTLIMHGDSLCTADVEYQAFRKTARDPRWQADILSRSLEDRRAFAAQLRTMSKEANSNKAEDIMDVTAAEVEQIMVRHQVRQLIHGHTHRPARHEGPGGVRWVLGDWGARGWVIRANLEGVELDNFII
jgi:UDP-2,3-diacylglucosamine hydrolase